MFALYICLYFTLINERDSRILNGDLKVIDVLEFGRKTLIYWSVSPDRRTELYTSLVDTTICLSVTL